MLLAICLATARTEQADGSLATKFAREKADACVTKISRRNEVPGRSRLSLSPIRKSRRRPQPLRRGIRPTFLHVCDSRAVRVFQSLDNRDERINIVFTSSMGGEGGGSSVTRCFAIYDISEYRYLVEADRYLVGRAISFIRPLYRARLRSVFPRELHFPNRSSEGPSLLPSLDNRNDFTRNRVRITNVTELFNTII